MSADALPLDALEGLARRAQETRTAYEALPLTCSAAEDERGFVAMRDADSAYRRALSPSVALALIEQARAAFVFQPTAPLPMEAPT